MPYGLQLVRDVLAGALKAGSIAADPFSYSATWAPLDPSSINVPRNINVDADADFLIVTSTLAASSAPGTAIADPDFTITIMDTGSGRYYQNEPVHVRNLFGTAQRPYVWNEPKLVAAASSLNLQLTNLTATGATVRITLGGIKIFYFRGFTRAQLGLWPAAA